MEPIAITGFSFRLPQGVEDEDAFWDVLQERKNVMTEWPESRANINGLFNDSPEAKNTVSARGGYFLREDPAAFDAPFFSITTREAAAMDPQQRWLLEASYRAIENAGLPMEEIAGSNTGVFAATMSDDYAKLIYKDPDEAPGAFATNAVQATLIANRLSWYFNFMGPSVHLNTACSGSTLALDLACSSLKRGQSSMALVAGVNTLITPEASLCLENMNFLSPDSRSYAFDQRANGYARAEGVIVLVLKRLSDAIRNGDVIRAVIRGSGSNHDGHTPGITQPSLTAQEQLIRAVYNEAGLGFRSTRYVEAHGTGTQLGDVTETNALGRVFRTVRSAKEPLFVGSVKTNIGHLEGGSGLAGIVKSIMILERGQIPPNALFEKLNPKIKAKLHNLQFPTTCLPWPTAGLRRISVNCFGFGGSNSHVILDDAFHSLEALDIKAIVNTPDSFSTSPVATNKPGPVTISHEVNGLQRAQNGDIENGSTLPECNGRLEGRVNRTRSESTCEHKLLIWSANDEAGLKRLLKAYSEYFERRKARPERFIEPLAYTLSARRSCMSWRSFAIVRETDTPNMSLIKPVRAVQNPGGLVFVFTGQGAQYAKMGSELLNYPVFHDVVSRSSAVMEKLGADWSFSDALHDEDRIHEPRISQPLCTILQIALVELLREFHIHPDAVIGHSSGEIAAAYTTGALSLESAVKIAYHRGRLAQRLTSPTSIPGAMMSVNISEANVDELLNDLSLGGRVSVACINSPLNVTLSGDESAIDKVQEQLEEEHTFARKLKTGVAYHSPAMKQIAEEYHACIGSVESGQPRRDIIMVSSVTGLKVSAPTLSQAQYWVDNLVSPVRFADVVRYIAVAAPQVDGLKKVSTFIELGPSGALKRPIHDTLSEVWKGQAFTYLPVLSKFSSATESTLEVVGQLFSAGYPVSVTNANQHNTDTRQWPFLVDTPAYPFDHSQLHWHESRLSRDWRFREGAPRGVLGVRAVDWNPIEPRWRKILRTSEMPWLEDHIIGENTLFPASGMINMALEAVRQTAQSAEDISGYRIKEATFMKPIIIRPEGEGEVVTQLRQLKQAYDKAVLHFEVTLFTVDDGSWAECSKFAIRLEYKDSPNEVDGAKEALMGAKAMAEQYSLGTEVATKTVDKKKFYKWGNKQGLNWRNHFALCEDIRWDGDKVATALVKTGPPVEQYEGIVHPAVLDSALQVIYVPASRGASEEMPTIIPYKFRNVWISATGWQYPQTRQLLALANSRARPNGTGIESTIDILSDDQSPLAHIEAIMMPIADHRPGAEGPVSKSLLKHIDWKPTLSLLGADQLRQYCRADSVGTDRSSVEDSRRQLKRLLQSVMRQNVQPRITADGAEAPMYMQAYVTSLKNWLHESAEGEVDISSNNFLHKELEALGSEEPSLRVFVEVAKHLLPIIRSEIDVSELVLSSSLVHNFYDDLFSRFVNRGLLSYVELVAHQTPALRIIEVGAGQGHMTKLMLSILEQIEAKTGGSAFLEYVYTDPSELNLETARASFSSHQSRMTFKTFDLEQEDPAQPFGPAGFDLVLTGGTGHATRSLAPAIHRLRSLLKPEGHLLLCDVLGADQYAMSFGFGVLSEWWSRDGDSFTPRQSTTEAEWDEMLRQNDFSGTDLVIGDCEDQDARFANIIVSTASPHTDEVATDDLKYDRVYLLVSEGYNRDKGSLDALVENTIRRLGHEMLVIPLESFESIETYDTDMVVIADLNGDLLAKASSRVFGFFESLIYREDRTGKLVWVTSSLRETGARSGIKDGFLRTLRAESSNKRIVSVSLEGDKEAPEFAEQVSKVFASLFRSDSPEVEYIIRDGQVMTGRLVEDADLSDQLLSSIQPVSKVSPWLPGPPLKLHIGSRGGLDTLHFREDVDYHKELGPTDVEIEAKAWAVNFRDVFSALGRLDDPGFGFDCAGVVTRVGPECKLVQPGDRVCMCVWDCMRMFPRTGEDAVIKIPSSVSYEEACAIIVPGMTAWHALVELARLRPGEKILIHSAAGATGQLAVQVAQMLGAEVFATVGYADKKQLLVDDYGIAEDHIFYSRSNNATFAKGVMRMTDGYGVDVVLNSLMGQGLRASWECIAPYGRFIEIGKADINADASLPMLPFAKNAMFASVDIRHMIIERPQMASKLLHEVMSAATQGKIHYPKPLHLFDVDAVEDAFRYIQGGKNTGRAIIRIEPSMKVEKLLVIRPTWEFDKDASYLVVGGLGGIGRSILKWMASRGAKYLIAPSRSGPTSAAAARAVKELQESGVTVLTPKCDAASWESMSSAWEEWTKMMPAIRGCINAAMVLNDSVFENMSHNQWEQTIRSKVDTSWNLHKLFHDLDFMVFLSSVSGIVGNPGQANYAAGCTFQDSLAHYRTSLGQHTTSIDLGVMRSVGVVAESEALQDHFGKGTQGLGQIEDDQFFALLDICCDPAASSSASLPSQIVMGLETPAELFARGLEPSEIMQRPIFAHFSQAPLSSHGKKSGGEPDFAAMFRQRQTPEERSDVVVQALQRRLARALGIESEDIDVEKPLHAYGVDSLVAVELRNMIGKEFVADVPVFELVGGRTVQSVADLVRQWSRIEYEGKSSPSPVLDTPKEEA